VNYRAYAKDDFERNINSYKLLKFSYVNNEIIIVIEIWMESLIPLLSWSWILNAINVTIIDIKLDTLKCS